MSWLERALKYVERAVPALAISARKALELLDEDGAEVAAPGWEEAWLAVPADVPADVLADVLRRPLAVLEEARGLASGAREGILVATREVGVVDGAVDPQDVAAMESVPTSARTAVALRKSRQQMPAMGGRREQCTAGERDRRLLPHARGGQISDALA